LFKNIPAGVKIMGRVRDARLQELKRLQRALDEARRFLDEFEARALRRMPRRPPKIISSPTTTSPAILRTDYAARVKQVLDFDDFVSIGNIAVKTKPTCQKT
jgi:hypothetical protein